MNKITKLLLLCLISTAAFSQTSRPADPLGSPWLNKIEGITANKYFRPPVMDVLSINGRPDSIGAIAIQRSDMNLYRYVGNGNWYLVGGAVNYYAGGSNNFTQTMMYVANGSELDIALYTPGKKVTSVTTADENGSGFLTGRSPVTIGDSTHIYYPYGPQDTIRFIFSGTITDTSVLLQPQVQDSSIGSNHILIHWKTIPHASAYEVQYSFTKYDADYKFLIVTQDTQYLHSGVPPNTLVYHRVRAIGDSVWYSSNFSYAKATTAALVQLATPSPNAVVNSNSKITISWAPIAHASKYVLRYKNEPSDIPTLLDTLLSTQTTYVHDSLSASTDFLYDLQALGDDTVYSNSEISGLDSVRTFSLSILSTPNIVIDSVHSDSIYMHWAAIPNAQSYLLQWSSSDSTFNLLTQTTNLRFAHGILNPGTKYYYKLTALADMVNYGNSLSDLDSATTANETLIVLPTAVETTSALSPTSILISWRTIPHASYYRLQKSVDNRVWTPLINTTDTSYLDTGLIAHTLYYYRVKGIGDSITYASGKIGVSSTTTLSLIPLSAVSATATANSSIQITLNWSVITHATNYVIEYTTGTKYDTAAIVTGSATSFTHNALNPSTLYKYRITTIGDRQTYGNSVYDSTSATTQAVVIVSTTLATPVLDATNTGSTTQNTVSWGLIPNAVGYIIEVSTNKTTWTALAERSASVTSLIDPNRTPSTKYYYRMYAAGDGVTYTNSAYSNIDSATTAALIPIATPNLSATSGGTSSIILNWNNVANESNYSLWYSLDKNNWVSLGTLAANTITYTHQNLTDATKYYYRIRGNGDGITYSNSSFDIDSATTEVIVTATQLATPVATVSVISSSQLNVGWNNVANETGYKIERSLNGTTWVVAATVAANVTVFNDAGRQPSTTYYYRVTATGDGFNYTDSKLSNVVNATTSASTNPPPATTFGVMMSTGSTQGNTTGAQNLGSTMIRTSYDGNGPNFPAYNNAFKVIWNYNPQTPGDGLPMPTDSFSYACTMDSMLQENGTKNLLGISIINEPNNVGYWTDNISASNYLRLLQACTNVAHRRGIECYDGGFTGPIMRYMVWDYLMKHGQPDSAADYQTRAFPLGTNLANWRTSSNYASRIKFMDTIELNLPNILTDAVNIHWYETVRDEDATKDFIDPTAFIVTCNIWSRIAHKPVITNEYGINNNTSANIVTQLINTVRTLKMKYALWYSSPSGVNSSLTTSNGTLTPLGIAYRNATGGNQ